MKGSELVALREEVGLNCSQAAAYLGVDRTTLARWEKLGEIPRLVAAGAVSMLKSGDELAEWVSAQKPVVRRAVVPRTYGGDSSNAETHTETVQSEHSQSGRPGGISACAHCERTAVEGNNPGQVGEVDSDEDPAGIEDNGAGDRRGVYGMGGGNQEAAMMAGDGNPVKIGEDVAALRSKLSMLLVHMGGKGMREFSRATAIPEIDIQNFINDNGPISDVQYSVMMYVLSERESI